MTGQQMLDLREYDLPPEWDGHPVSWDRGWSERRIFICPPPSGPRCDQCGSTKPPLMKTGLVGPFVTAARNKYNEIVTSRNYVALRAMRCPECHTDLVMDGAGDVWEMGPEDYGARGSYLQAVTRITKGATGSSFSSSSRSALSAL